MIVYKEGVRIRGIRPELWLAIKAAEDSFDFLGQQLVVTSIVDGVHSSTSLHYVGHAFDCRTKHLSPERRLVILDDLKQRLAPLGDFDVVLETDHLHVEYQPKGALNK